PAYYFLLFVYFIMCCFGIIHIRPGSWITAITYTKYFNWSHDWYTGHAWSLSVEEHFYILWPFIFTAGDKLRKTFIFLILLLIPLIRYYSFFHPSVSWINYL